MIPTVAASLVAFADSFMVPGVSLELARYRAERIRDVRYEIALNVTNRDTATGTVRVAFTRVGAGDVILDFRGYTLDSVAVNGSRLAGVEFNRAHLRIPAAGLRPGSNTVVMRFATPIAAAGASIIRFTDDTDRRDYLYTLLVPSDANLLFPCFDQPDIKAVFALTLTVPRDWKALSNGAQQSREEASGQARVRFAATQPISTYLFAFAAGPYAQLTAAKAPPAAGADVTPMSIWVRPSRAREVEIDTLIALNHRAKEWLAAYFGVQYPFGKMDFLLAPAFPFGGMEHPGAIFYNEESFIYREPPTLVQRLGRQATINHEVAHQWFGDYTTMRWFDDLWMKEGFATYMSAKMQHAMGDSTAWMSFYLRNKATAYDVDVTAGTTPVWQVLGNLDQAKSNYGPIVYNKAPSVLKQLDHLVGTTAFRAGVRDFLMQHAFGNATWRELLQAIGRQAGRDLTSWGQAFFVRPGMPVIEQELTLGNDGKIDRLALIQRPAQQLSGDVVWPMKVDVLLRIGSRDSIIPVEMRAETTVVVPARGLAAPTYVYANANDFGYGLFMLDDRSRDWLLSNRVNVSDPFLRAMFWGSLWDLVRDARLDPRRYLLAAIPAMLAEQDEQITARLLGRVSRIVERYSTSITNDARERIEEALLRGATDGTKPYGLRKNFFDTYVTVARTPRALVRLNAWLDSTTAAGEPLRQPTRWSIVTALTSRAFPTAAARLEQESVRDTSTGGKRRAFIAAAATPDPAVKRDYFTRYFADASLNEDWVTSSLGAFNDPAQSPLTLQYLRPALDTLAWVQKNRRIFFLGRWLDAFIGGHDSHDALAVIDRFLLEHPNLPRDLRLKVLQSRDDLERTVRIRKRFGGS
ncbi:MAG TPA: M1 family aminopeptidase [Gemmatimonadaceae bacterium]|nr:M1 family aminopeptidase [Gemmatimonadaceae bacterium]